MLHDLLHGLIDWVVAWANTPWSALALFILAFAESSFFLIPPDLLLIACGVLNSKLSLLYALICTVGSVMGGAFGYWIGLKGGRPILDRFISQKKLHAIEHLYQKYDVWAVGIAGFTPIPYKLFTVSGGAFKLDFWKFILVSFVSRGARFFLIGVLFYFFGETVEHYLDEYFDIGITVFAVLLIGGFIAIKFFADRLGSKSTPQTDANS